MLFPSDDWAAAWVAISNADPAFRAAGQGWQGAVGCVVKSGGRYTGPALYLRLDGVDGCWQHHELGRDPGLAERTAFTLTADYAVWKKIIRQELDPLRGLVLGQVRLRGQMSQALRWIGALRRMTELAAELDTTFADERTT